MFQNFPWDQVFESRLIELDQTDVTEGTAQLYLGYDVLYVVEVCQTMGMYKRLLAKSMLLMYKFVYAAVTKHK